MSEAEVLKNMLKKFAHGDLLLLSEASRILNLPESYLLSAINNGQLGAFRVGNDWFIEEKQLNVFRLKINQRVAQELSEAEDACDVWHESVVSSDFYLLAHNLLRSFGIFSGLTLIGSLVILMFFSLSIFWYQMGQDYRQTIKNFDQRILSGVASWEQKQQRFNDESITRVLASWGFSSASDSGRVLGEVESNNIEEAY